MLNGLTQIPDMQDIVERLERAAEADKFANARQLKLEAADEIKRLRAALTERHAGVEQHDADRDA
jgi:hypothetical protein